MDILILKFFTAEKVNKERDIRNAFREWNEAYIPHCSISVNDKLEISEKEIKKYFKKWNKFVEFDYLNKPPYIALVSDNAENDLQVLINSWNDETGVTCDDISCYSNYVITDLEKEKKHTFWNR